MSTEEDRDRRGESWQSLARRTGSIETDFLYGEIVPFLWRQPSAGCGVPVST